MFKDITPSSILISENVKALAEGGEEVFYKILQEIINVVIYPRIDELPEEVVDLLAWQFHVDEYFTAKTLEEKRNIVKKAIELHRYKGTKYSVEETLKWLLSITAKVIEWFEYNGNPYRFKLKIFSSIDSSEKWEDLIKVVIAYKNVRSWLEGIIQERNYRNNIYQGSAIRESKNTSIFLSVFIPDLQNRIFTGEALRIQRKTVIGVLN